MFADLSVKLRLEQLLRSDMNYIHSGLGAISG
jgi:hypothetical protein